ncbi:MAG: response regulator [Desulfobacteraceae bacterium]|nr:MAG: response regulator [Desulfobacteraceae bacterium]
MSRAKVLIVEDEGIEALDLEHRLISLGYASPGVASTGEEAVKMAQELCPDLVLMDIMLPGKIDGVTAAEKIQERFDIPIIYLTAYADEATLQRAKITEPYGYIVKPFKERELHITIDMALYKHKMERKLKESEKWLSTTLRSIGDAVIATDKAGMITFMNPVAEGLTGWQLEDALNRKLSSVLNIINRDTRCPVENPVEKVILLGTIVGLANHTKLIGKDGAEIPIDDSAAPIKDDKGNLIGVILVFRDITEREKADEELHRAYDELEERVRERTAELNRRVEQLARLSSELTLAEQRERRRLAEMLHDHLQQLLVAAKINIEALSSQIGAEQKQAADAVRDLIADSIKASRFLTAELSPPVLYQQGLTAALEWLAKWMQEKYEFTVQLQVIEVGFKQEDINITLYQAVRELLFNAVKHAQVSSARVRMFKDEEGRLRIIVDDSGVGFDPKKTCNETEQGTGFGLCAIRERMEFMGGRFEMESARGRGSTFTMIAPLGGIEKVKRKRIGRRVTDLKDIITAQIAGGQKTKITVMLVDDHAVMRQGISTMLGLYSDIELVGEATDGEEAIGIARKLRPDVILMDIGMPKVNGIEATRVIHSELPQTRIIGLSMFDADEQAAAMIEAGATAYCLKSDDFNTIVAAIRGDASGSFCQDSFRFLKRF